MTQEQKARAYDEAIEKACEAFCKVCKMPNCNSKDCSYLKDFRNHMKGE